MIFYDGQFLLIYVTLSIRRESAAGEVGLLSRNMWNLAIRRILLFPQITRTKPYIDTMRKKGFDGNWWWWFSRLKKKWRQRKIDFGKKKGEWKREQSGSEELHFLPGRKFVSPRPAGYENIEVKIHSLQMTHPISNIWNVKDFLL